MTSRLRRAALATLAIAALAGVTACQSSSSSAPASSAPATAAASVASTAATTATTAAATTAASSAAPTTTATTAKAATAAPTAFCDGLRDFHAFELRYIAAGGTNLEPANMKASIEGRIERLTALEAKAPADLKPAVSTLLAMWTEIQGLWVAASYDPAAANGRQAGAGQLAAYKKYGYPGMFTPVVTFAKVSCALDLLANA